MKLGEHNISDYHKPFIIAEMSGNHNQSLDRAKKIIKAAADCGAHARAQIAIYRLYQQMIVIVQKAIRVTEPVRAPRHL